MRYTRATRYALLLTLAILVPALFANLVPKAHAATAYYLAPIPGFTQEGYTITLDLVVVGASPSTTYQFVFLVKDPSGKNWTSTVQTHNTTASETQFFLPVIYPSTSFIGTGTNSLCCLYHAQVNQIKPSLLVNVASTPFDIILTDKGEYQRTETVNIHATGYNASETVSVTIRTFTTSTLVFSQTIQATSSTPIGVVATSWKIPKNATIDTYVLTLTGTSTTKSPPDLQGFTVKAAVMSISALTSTRATYQRTQMMGFSFQPVYPDGSIANTGAALLTLARPSGPNITLTAAYDSTANDFIARYKTTFNNETGTWTATLQANSYGDGYGNAGPSTKLTNNPQLIPATFTINVNATTYVPIGQKVKFNATITYPDGTALQSGLVGAYLLFSGTPTANDTFPLLVFDTGLRVWVGSYTPQSTDPGGLWSLVIRASDTPVPPNTGSATKAVTLQDRPPVASFTVSPSSAPTGTSISFSGTASYDPDGTVVTYAWNFGDGATGTGSTANHSYNIAGSFTVTLTVTDNGGLTGSTSLQVTITDRPPTLSFNPSPATVTTGQLVTLSIIASDPDGTITTIRVDWGDGTIDTLAGTSTSDSHSYNSTGSTTSKAYTVTVVATDNAGLPTSTSAQITVNDKLPIVTFSPSSTTAITGQTVTVSITSSDPDGTVSTTRVDWGDGTVDALSGSASTDRHSYTLTGSATSKTFTITVTVTDNSGSTASNTGAVTVQAASSSNGNVSFPLYYFGILAAIIAALLAGGFLAFRRHRVTHAKLKIDLEAVRSEAGRIENQEFFQSVKDQLKKDKDD